MDNTIPTLDPTPENLTGRLKRWCSATWAAINEAKLLASLDDETVKLLAQDNALSEQELRELIAKGPHAADEMLALMKLLNIDPEEARLEEPAEFREMHVTCVHCGEKDPLSARTGRRQRRRGFRKLLRQRRTARRHAQPTGTARQIARLNGHLRQPDGDIRSPGSGP
ncbi:hypothetical protein LZK73_08715 [Neorhizobium galegae]|nr:hypothetical protein LZK73_08715 [Neorhizobium galegae]